MRARALKALALVVQLSAVASYSLLRSSNVPPTPGGIPCIAIAPARLNAIVAPGQRATLHLYDASSIQVLRHAQAHANGTFGQVVLDEAALVERKFRLLGVGSRVKVLTQRPSTHTDKFGGTSNSVLAEVIGVGIIEPDEVLQREPYMSVTCGVNDAMGAAQYDHTEAELAEWHEALVGAAMQCAQLGDVALTGTPPGPGTDMSTKDWSLPECIDSVRQLRRELQLGRSGGDDVDVAEAMGVADSCAVVDEAASTLQLSALASTAHLPGALRLEAMELARQGPTALASLLELVQEALLEEARRRRAVKAIASALEGGE